MDINNYMTPNEAAHRYNININTLKDKMKPSKNEKQIEEMIQKGLIKYFIEPNKTNRSWIISTEAIEVWFPKEFENYQDNS